MKRQPSWPSSSSSPFAPPPICVLRTKQYMKETCQAIHYRPAQSRFHPICLRPGQLKFSATRLMVLCEFLFTSLLHFMANNRFAEWWIHLSSPDSLLFSSLSFSLFISFFVWFAQRCQRPLRQKGFIIDGTVLWCGIDDDNLLENQCSRLHTLDVYAV